MATKKIRVYELARELGVDNAVVVELSNELKIGVKSHSSSIDEPSADRVAAPEGACGGSVFAHIAYERQRRIKSAIIEDAFRRVGRIPLESPVDVAKPDGSVVPVESDQLRESMEELYGGPVHLIDEAVCFQTSDGAPPRGIVSWLAS